MPFVTEEIWQALPHAGETICLAPYPAAEEGLIDIEAEAGMTLLIDSITALRGLRAEFTPGGPENEAARAAMLARRFTVTITPETDAARATLQDQRLALITLARLGDVTLQSGPLAPDNGETRVEPGEDKGRVVSVGVPGAMLSVPADELLEDIDPGRETARLNAEIAKLDKELAGLNARLANPNFVERAAPEAVEKARTDAEELAGRRAKLEARRGLLA